MVFNCPATNGEHFSSATPRFEAEIAAVFVAHNIFQQGFEKILNMNPSTLRSRMQKLNIKRPGRTA